MRHLGHGRRWPVFQTRLLPLHQVQPRMQYAVTAHGDRFFVNTVVEPAIPSPITVVLNSPALLKP